MYVCMGVFIAPQVWPSKSRSFCSQSIDSELQSKGKKVNTVSSRTQLEHPKTLDCG